MSDIYTRTGDDGTTELADGSRVAKDSARIELFGALDEANCHIGLARVLVVDSDLEEMLAFLQNRLFNCAACVATTEPTIDMPRISEEDVAALEAAIDRFARRVGVLSGFLLPGCDEVSARLHVARAVMRRAERRAVALIAHERALPEVLAFLNRASDLLYIAARHAGGGAECLWQPDMEAPLR
jgi:cob(I)alamin adenosyltransferase